MLCWVPFVQVTSHLKCIRLVTCVQVSLHYCFSSQSQHPFFKAPCACLTVLLNTFCNIALMLFTPWSENPEHVHTWISKNPRLPWWYPWFLDVSLQFSIHVWISTLISKQGYPCKDIIPWMSVKHEYPRMDIHVSWISVFNYPCFYWYPFGYLLISMDIHAWTCYGFLIQGKRVRNKSGNFK